MELKNDKFQALVIIPLDRKVKDLLFPAELLWWEKCTGKLLKMISSPFKTKSEIPDMYNLGTLT